MSWSKKKAAQPEVYPSVIDGLKKIYARALKPLEEMYRFDAFHMPIMRDSDFDAKPSVLFLGQYSTGKTSFIRYLLEGNYPGANIGPEPTTDRFVAIMGGKEEMIIPGNALVVQNGMPFRGLSKFGNDFLNSLYSLSLSLSHASHACSLFFTSTTTMNNNRVPSKCDDEPCAGGPGAD